MIVGQRAISWPGYVLTQSNKEKSLHESDNHLHVSGKNIKCFWEVAVTLGDVSFFHENLIVPGVST
jgi:hypothetical protein